MNTLNEWADAQSAAMGENLTEQAKNDLALKPLRIVGDFTLASCQECGGEGKIKHEDFERRDGKKVRGGGFLPCPKCLGKKVVPS